MLNQDFYRPDLLTVAQPTVSNHWRGATFFRRHWLFQEKKL